MRCSPRRDGQLTDYLAGSRSDFDLPTTMRGDEQQHRVWQQLTTIPYGETATYGELAASLADGTTAKEVNRPSVAIRSASSSRATGWSGATVNSPAMRAA